MKKSTRANLLFVRKHSSRKPKCHSPSSSDGEVKSSKIRQGGEVLDNATVKLGSTASPSSFDKDLKEVLLHINYDDEEELFLLINCIKSIVERDYRKKTDIPLTDYMLENMIEKQKVKDFIKNKREHLKKSIDMSPFGIARQQQELVLTEIEKELLR